MLCSTFMLKPYFLHCFLSPFPSFFPSVFCPSPQGAILTTLLVTRNFSGMFFLAKCQRPDFKKYQWKQLPFSFRDLRKLCICTSSRRTHQLLVFDWKNVHLSSVDRTLEYKSAVVQTVSSVFLFYLAHYFALFSHLFLFDLSLISPARTSLVSTSTSQHYELAWICLLYS